MLYTILMFADSKVFLYPVASTVKCVYANYPVWDHVRVISEWVGNVTFAEFLCLLEALQNFESLQGSSTSLVSPLRQSGGVIC